MVKPSHGIGMRRKNDATDGGWRMQVAQPWRSTALLLRRPHKRRVFQPFSGGGVGAVGWFSPRQVKSASVLFLTYFVI